MLGGSINGVGVGATVGPMEAPILAVDVGGTKLAAGVVSAAGRLLDCRSVETPTTDDGNELFECLARLMSTFAPFDRYSVCGVGCGGPMTRGGDQVSPVHIPAWRDYGLRERLGRLTGLEVGLENDAKALALAEGWVGAAMEADDYMAMVVSTGIGGGIVLNRQLLHGGSGNAGHIGHVVVSQPGRALPGHVSGVLEAEVSGTAIAYHTGRPAAEADTALIAETGRLVGQAAGSVANLLDIQLVVVAGSVAIGFGEHFFAAAQAEMNRVCRLDFSRSARITPAGCGHEGPLIGAAAVGLRALGQRPGGIH